MVVRSRSAATPAPASLNRTAMVTTRMNGGSRVDPSRNRRGRADRAKLGVWRRSSKPRHGNGNVAAGRRAVAELAVVVLSPALDAACERQGARVDVGRRNGGDDGGETHHVGGDVAL